MSEGLPNRVKQDLHYKEPTHRNLRTTKAFSAEAAPILIRLQPKLVLQANLLTWDSPPAESSATLTALVSLTALSPKLRRPSQDCCKLMLLNAYSSR